MCTKSAREIKNDHNIPKFVAVCPSNEEVVDTSDNFRCKFVELPDYNFALEAGDYAMISRRPVGVYKLVAVTWECLDTHSLCIQRV